MSNTNREILREKVLEQFNAFKDQVFKDGGKLDQLFLSGAIDIIDDEIGYKTSSKINMALGMELTRQYDNCMTKNDRKDVKNMSLFI